MSAATFAQIPFPRVSRSKVANSKVGRGESKSHVRWSEKAADRTRTPLSRMTRATRKAICGKRVITRGPHSFSQPRCPSLRTYRQSHRKCNVMYCGAASARGPLATNALVIAHAGCSPNARSRTGLVPAIDGNNSAVF